MHDKPCISFVHQGQPLLEGRRQRILIRGFEVRSPGGPPLNSDYAGCNYPLWSPNGVWLLEGCSDVEAVSFTQLSGGSVCTEHKHPSAT
jgi:hypothetical protein